MAKKLLEEEIIDFLNDWGSDQMRQLIVDIFPLIELYDVDEEDDWLKDIVGELETKNIRLLRTVYIISKLAWNHAGRLVQLNVKYKKLWEKMEKQSLKR